MLTLSLSTVVIWPAEHPQSVLFYLRSGGVTMEFKLVLHVKPRDSGRAVSLDEWFP